MIVAGRCEGNGINPHFSNRPLAEDRRIRAPRLLCYIRDAG
jgi:hypothetical protein